MDPTLITSCAVLRILALMKLSYNAPVVLTGTILAAIVMALDNATKTFTANYFTLGGSFHFDSLWDYVRLFSYTLGHADWNHLVGNFTLILLIGPILEEKYGSKKLLLMIGVTALATALLHILLFNNGALGASGIVFMMILLGSFVNYKSGTLPITFILVVLLFIGREVYDAFKEDSISQFAHIFGGVCGTAFGFVLNKGKA